MPPNEEPNEATALATVRRSLPDVVASINHLVSEIFVTRGGRRGAGLGLLLEGLWGTRTTSRILDEGIEIGWIADNQYNDYACIRCNEAWNPDTRSGELFRIEAKTMDQDADESKGHFDQIQSKIGPYDQLLVLFWRWDTDGTRSWPQVIDAFLDSAMEIAELRDQLHLARGGRFVDGSSCPDKCVPGSCPHAGEPLNARGIRERRFGPSATRGANVSYAANFGGLVRMLKTQNVEASKAFKKMRRESDVAHNYISFIHRHLPAEELNAYSTAEWGELYEQVIGKIPKGMRPAELRSQISAADSGYRELLRSIDLTQGS